MMQSFAGEGDFNTVADGRAFSHQPRVRERWYRSPILWLGAALLAASIAGCIVTIILALQHAETPLPTGGEQLLKVPLAHRVQADISPEEQD